MATMLATKTIVEEFGHCFGEKVGYVIWFEDYIRFERMMKCMTHGLLLRKILIDEQFVSYYIHRVQ
jgi:HrpA-like RNA helicase